MFHLPKNEVYRLQRLLYTTGALRHLIDGSTIKQTLEHYILAIELAVQPPLPCNDNEHHSFMDICLSTCLLGFAMSLPPGGSIPESVLDSLGAGPDFLQQIFQPGSHLLTLVRNAGPNFANLILQPAGILPTLLLLPEQAMRLSILLFSSSVGVLPSICSRNSHTSHLEPPSEFIRQQTSLLTSTIL